jgi:hypothetical protein
MKAPIPESSYLLEEETVIYPGVIGPSSPSQNFDPDMLSDTKPKINKGEESAGPKQKKESSLLIQN